MMSKTMSKVTKILVPQENPNDEYITIVSLATKSGDQVEKGQVVLVAETMKNTFDICAPESGYIHFNHEEGDQVNVGEEVAVISETATFEVETPPENNEVGDKSRISRKAMKLIRDHNLDESVFSHLNEIKEKDIQSYLTNNAASKIVSKKGLGDQNSDLWEVKTPSAIKLREVRILSKSSDQVVYSKASAVLSVSKLTEKMTAMSDEKLGRVTIGEFITHACGKCLKEFPLMNGFFEDDRFYLYRQCNVGYALNLGQGLKVPIVFNCDQKSLHEVSHLIKEYSMMYMRDELTSKEVKGGTFTITDLSSTEIVEFNPVVNYRQSAILGICAKHPLVDSMELVVGFDHRILDAMEVGRFFKVLKEKLQ